MTTDGKQSDMDDTRKIEVSNNRITSRELIGGKKELRIIHNEEEYTLRLTANGKLILTK